MSIAREVRRDLLGRVGQELEAAEVVCEIYQGVLADGTLSPGFLPYYDQSGFAMAWVVPRSALRTSEFRDDIRGTAVKDGPEAAAQWARDNVRLVSLDFSGTVFEPSPAEYEVMVNSPFRLAKRGRLVNKAGATVQMEVPDGETLQERSRRSLSSRSSSLATRLSAVRGHFMSQDGGYKGPGLELNERRFPRFGDKWA